MRTNNSKAGKYHKLLFIITPADRKKKTEIIVPFSEWRDRELEVGMMQDEIEIAMQIYLMGMKIGIKSMHSVAAAVYIRSKGAGFEPLPGQIFGFKHSSVECAQNRYGNFTLRINIKLA